MASNEQPTDNHSTTYGWFTTATKWGVVVIVSVLLALYVFLV